MVEVQEDEFQNGDYKKESIKNQSINHNKSNENWEKIEREFIKEDIEDMNIINRMILEINNLWEKFNKIGITIEKEMLCKYYNDKEEDYIYEIERMKINDNKACLIWKGKNIYNIMEKMNNVKLKIVKRKSWKIRNINYIERLLNITESKNIFWRIEESGKIRKEKIDETTNDFNYEIIDIYEIEELLPINRYSLYWKRNLINNNIRDTVKKCNKLKYIAEWLTLKINKNLLLNINNNEINWGKTFEHIKNIKEGGTLITSDKDKTERIYQY
ncbi:hypothetical protein C1645_872801 [Glomus cerebriforme]|uniref:Uncharacterized protein n=1 Tax=Glomus cerebriforme TaxID=658196 RepID=A0A397TEJ3_9GLOM|nr:hypothetical protein C1645_872801 [Glomus cerebriforme]